MVLPLSRPALSYIVHDVLDETAGKTHALLLKLVQIEIMFYIMSSPCVSFSRSDGVFPAVSLNLYCCNLCFTL